MRKEEREILGKEQTTKQGTERELTTVKRPRKAKEERDDRKHT